MSTVSQDFDPATFDPAAVPAEEAALAAEVLTFWEGARQYAGLGRTSVVTGALVSDTVPPQAWSFGGDDSLGDTLVEAVLSGAKTATSSALSDYEDEEATLPQPGELAIVLDGAGHPRALIRTTAVDVVPFDEVTEEFALAEGEGDGSLEEWRAEHEQFFRSSLGEGREFAPDLPVVCERFELLYPKK